MKRVFLMLSACLIMAMVFAPAAGAQTVFPESDGSGATIGDGCPAGQFGAIPPNTLGEVGFDCFVTLEEAQYYAETGKLLPDPQSTICHVPANNPEDARTIAYPRSASAPQSHLTEHPNDYRGPCREPGKEEVTNGTQNAGENQYDDEVPALPDTGGLPLDALAAGLVAVAVGGLLLKRYLS